MTKWVPEHLFPTMVVGSLPRHEWIRELIADRKIGSITYTDVNKLLDGAIESAIYMQERSGLDFVSDGEWRRESYVKVFSEAVDGFADDLITLNPSNISRMPYPAVTNKIVSRRYIAVDEARFLLKHAKSRTMVAIPSPYTIARRMWVQEHSHSAYSTRWEFMEACIPIVRDEIIALSNCGIDVVQLDDPWLALLVDPEYRRVQGISDIDREIEMSVKSINRSVEGVDDISVSVHMCHAHFNREHMTKGPYDLIIGALSDMKVDRFAMEFATPDAGGVHVLRDFPSDKLLGLGVIDHTDDRVESPDDVVVRTESAMEYVPQERITLNPDCGFSPSSANPANLDEAYLKLKSLCEGAARLRQKYG